MYSVSPSDGLFIELKSECKDIIDRGWKKGWIFFFPLCVNLFLLQHHLRQQLVVIKIFS